jgi:uncharacterized DUF497 family protein
MSEKPIVWDQNKNRANRTKHKIDFSDAADVFFDPLAITTDDPGHSWNENSFVTIGETAKKKVVVVFYAENEKELRIISARKPTRSEMVSYEQERRF